MAGIDKTTSAEDIGSALVDLDLFRYSKYISPGVYESRKQEFSSIRDYVADLFPTADSPLLSPFKYANNETIADGALISLTTLGYLQSEANEAWPLTADYFGGNVPLDMSIDTVAVIECNLAARKSANQNAIYYGIYKGNEYSLNYEIPLQIPEGEKIGTNFIHNFDGCTMRSYHSGNIFGGLPTDQTQADLIVDRTFTFSNGTFYGSDDAGDGSMCFNIGACVYANWTNCVISRCDYGWRLKYALFSQFINCAGIGCWVNNWWLSSGDWTDASLSNSQCNDSDFLNCRTFNALNTGGRGMRFEDSSDINLIGCTTEGGESGTQSNQPICAIYFNDNNSTVVKGINIDGLHAEQSYTRAIVELHGREGTYRVSDLYNQKQGIYSSGQNSNYVWVQNNAGVMNVIMDSILYATDYMTFYNHNQFNHWFFYTPQIVNSPLTKYQLLNCQNFGSVTIWNGVIPDYDKVTLTPISQFDYNQTAAPTNGATVNIAIEKEKVLINPAGTIAGVTLGIPVGAYDGQPLDILFTQTITTISYTGASFIASPGTTAIAGTHFRLKWCASISKWG